MTDVSEAAVSTARQFVSFGVGGEMFAVPLAQVREIIRYPDVVKAPLGPPSLEGLGNLRGTVLPILSLRRMLGVEYVDHNDATRVVVINDDGRPVGVVVDRMANVMTVEPECIESADLIRSTISTDLLTGVIKNRDNESMVMILDASLVIRRDFRVVADPATAGPAATSQTKSTAAPAEADGISEIQLVSFSVAGQEYALPIEQVQEIVQVPASITEVPNCGSHVLGVMTLRDRLLPLVSLRRMFNLADSEISEANKIVVVSTTTGLSVGMVMDSVREVLRVSRTLVDPVPEMLSRSRELNEITSICRLSGGTRLVSILSADRLFAADELRGLHAAGETDDTLVAVAQTQGEIEAVVDDEEQLIVFRLMGEEYAVPIESVQEIVRVPDELVRVPKTPDFIEGVVNLRGAVLPVVDQRRRFGLPGAERNDRQRIVVFAIQGTRTGFIVDSVSQVIRVPVHLIGPAPELSAEQHRLIRRVVNLTEQKRMILMLEVDQLLDTGELGQLVMAAAA